MRNAVLGWVTALALFIAGLTCAIGGRSTPTQPSAAQTSTPSILISQEAYQNLLDRISSLEADNKAIKVEASSFRSSSERLGVDCALVATYLGLIAAVVGVVIAAYGAIKFSLTLKTFARVQAINVAGDLESMLEGRFNLVIGYVLAQVAWDKKDSYAPRGLNHIADEVLRITERSYNKLKTPSAAEFKAPMSKWRFLALNNLLFYISLKKDPQSGNEAFAYAQELKSAPDFLEKTNWVNTYCRATLTFLDVFAKCKAMSEIQPHGPSLFGFKLIKSNTTNRAPSPDLCGEDAIQRAKSQILMELKELCRVQDIKLNSLQGTSLNEYLFIKKELAAIELALRSVPQTS